MLSWRGRAYINCEEKVRRGQRKLQLGEAGVNIGEGKVQLPLGLLVQDSVPTKTELMRIELTLKIYLVSHPC